VGDFVDSQGFERETVGEILPEPTHLGSCEDVVQFRLPEQDESQWIVAVRLDLRQMQDCLQRLDRHGMRLVDQHQRPLAFMGKFDQAFLDGAGADLFAADSQSTGDGTENVLPGQGRIGQMDGRHIGRQPFHHHQAGHGLAAAGLANNPDVALVIDAGIEQGVKGGAASGPGEIEPGVRRDAKQCFAQTEVVEVHVGLPRFPESRRERVLGRTLRVPAIIAQRLPL